MPSAPVRCQRRGERSAHLRRHPQPGMRFGVGPRVAVVVGATGREEALLRRHLGHRLGRRPVERAVVDLESAQTGIDQLAKQVAMRKRLAEVGQRCEPARCPDGLDRADRAESGTGHVRRAAAPDEPLERILDARRVTRADERPGDRRPAERVVIAQVELGERLVDRQPELPQDGDGPLEPFPASRSLGREDRFELVVCRVHAEAEDVELALPQVLPIDDGVDLDAGDQLEAVGHGACGQEVSAACQSACRSARHRPPPAPTGGNVTPHTCRCRRGSRSHRSGGGPPPSLPGPSPRSSAG